jgi:hypothetical protein
MGPSPDPAIATIDIRIGTTPLSLSKSKNDGELES